MSGVMKPWNKVRAVYPNDELDNMLSMLFKGDKDDSNLLFAVIENSPIKSELLTFLYHSWMCTRYKISNRAKIEKQYYRIEKLTDAKKIYHLIGDNYWLNNFINPISSF